MKESDYIVPSKTCKVCVTAGLVLYAMLVLFVLYLPYAYWIK